MSVESIFVASNQAAWLNPDGTASTPDDARSRALLWRSTNLAIESAFSHGIDLPVGAVAAAGNQIVGRYFASDHRLRHWEKHAEYMALADYRMTAMTSGAYAPDTIVVSLEPCDDCQDYLATQHTIKRVGFGLSRTVVEERGLIKPHAETIFERAERVHLPYEVFQIEEPQLEAMGLAVFDHTHRDPQTEAVMIDYEGLQAALMELNAA